MNKYLKELFWISGSVLLAILIILFAYGPLINEQENDINMDGTPTYALYFNIFLPIVLTILFLVYFIRISNARFNNVKLNSIFLVLSFIILWQYSVVTISFSPSWTMYPPNSIIPQQATPGNYWYYAAELLYVLLLGLEVFVAIKTGKSLGTNSVENQHQGKTL